MNSAKLVTALALVVILLLGWGCDRERVEIVNDEGCECAGIVDSLEPNEDFAHATALEFGRLYPRLTICGQERDLYSFTLTEAATITVSTEIQCAAQDTSGHPYWKINFLRAEDESYGYVGIGAEPRIVSYGHSFLPGTYYAEISTGEYSREDDDIVYDLAVTATDPCQDDGYEDNDFADEAPLIEPGQYALRGCDVDKDYFRLTVEAGETVRAAITSPVSGTRQLELAVPGQQRIQETSVQDTIRVEARAMDAGQASIAARFWQECDYTLTVEKLTSEDQVRPTVTAFSLPDSATGVGLLTPIEVTFSEAMNPASVTSGALALDGDFEAGQVDYDVTAHVARFSPHEAYESDVWHRLTVSGARDLSGNLVVPDSLVFHTIAVDHTRPTVTAFSLADGATGVGLITPILVTFSEAMGPASVTSGAIYIVDDPSYANIEYDEATRTATFQTTTVYPPDAWVTLLVSDAHDLAGNPVIPDTLEFHTVPLACESFDDPFEPNDEYASATPVVIGQSFSGLTICGGERDIYSFTVDETAAITVATTIRSASTDSAPAYSWYTNFARGENDYYATYASDPVQVSYARTYNFLPGTYYAEVHTGIDVDPDDLVVYDLAFSAGEPCPEDEYEDNDFPDEARLVTPGFYMLRSCYIDQDYFLVAMQPGDTLQLTLFSGASGFRRLEATAPGSDWVSQFGSQSPMQLRTTATEAGAALVATRFWDDCDYSLNIERIVFEDHVRPTVTAFSLADSATGVGLLAPIRVTFSEDMDPASVQSAIGLSGHPGEGEVEFDAGTRTATYTPNLLYPPDSWLTLEVEGATDLAGNAVVADHLDFQTLPLACESFVDSLEPNEEIATAAPVEIGREYRGLTLCGGEKDRYSFTLTEAATINVVTDVVSVPGRSADVLWLQVNFLRADDEFYSAYGKQAVLGAWSVGFSFLPGTYYVEVLGNLDPDGLIVYHLSLSASTPCQDDAYEDNDFADQAPLIDTGAYPLRGCAGDLDNFRVDLNAGETLRVTAASTQPGTRALRLKVPGQDLVSLVNEEESIQVEATATQAGEALVDTRFWQDCEYTLTIEKLNP
ncbi:MAG: Ig-like domain-containing protein [Candidatus Eisenbacteria bacterium]|nr:Ig-like domain-containing protein [Candidatus Eisenbacteria bacterium]